MLQLQKAPVESILKEMEQVVVVTIGDDDGLFNFLLLNFYGVNCWHFMFPNLVETVVYSFDLENCSNANSSKSVGCFPMASILIPISFSL